VVSVDQVCEKMFFRTCLPAVLFIAKKEVVDKTA
jgi:hypothetical protein